MATVFTNVGKQVTTNRVKGSGTEPSYDQRHLSGCWYDCGCWIGDDYKRRTV